MYELFYEHVFSFLMGIYLGAELLGHMATLCLTFEKLLKHFFKVATSFTFPPSSIECSSFSISSLIFAMLFFIIAILKKMKYICLTMLLVSAIQRCEYVNTYIYCKAAAAAAKLRQSCLSLCNPIDGSPPGSPQPGILQARILEWVAISFSNAWKWKVKVKSRGRVWLPATPCTAAYQAPPSMGFSSYMYTYISSFLSLPPILPSHPFRSSVSTKLSSLCYMAASH